MEALIAGVEGYCGAAAVAALFKVAVQRLHPPAALELLARLRCVRSSGKADDGSSLQDGFAYDPALSDQPSVGSTLLRLCVVYLVARRASWSQSQGHGHPRSGFARVVRAAAAVLAVVRALDIVPLRALLIGRLSDRIGLSACVPVPGGGRAATPVRVARERVQRMPLSMVPYYGLLGLDTHACAGVHRATHAVERQDGSILTITQFTPGRGSATAIPDACCLYYHGGGWVLPDCHADLCGMLADRSGMIVLSVDYRLAPEFKYPAAHEDALHAFLWTCDNARELGVDPAKVFVAGDSAGGNLAAAVGVLCRESFAAVRNMPAGQVLIYPATDHRMLTPSIQAYGSRNHFLSRTTMEWFGHTYVPDAHDAVNQVASPLLAKHHDRLPPALIVLADQDVLKDEGVLYAASLARGGTPVEMHTARRAPHGFMNMKVMYPAEHEAATAAIVRFLRFRAWVKTLPAAHVAEALLPSTTQP